MKRLKVVSGIAAYALTVGVATAGAGLGGGGDVGGFGDGGCPPAGMGAPCIIDGTSGTDATGSTIGSTVEVVGSELTQAAHPTAHVDTSTDPHAVVLIGTIEASGDAGAGEVDLTEDSTCPPAGMGPCTIG